jgi:hypothetical protein
MQTLYRCCCVGAVMIVARIPLEDYELEVQAWVADVMPDAILPRCGMDMNFHWRKNQDKSIEISWWPVLMLAPAMIAIVFLNLIAYPLSLSFRLFVDSAFIGNLYLQQIQLFTSPSGSRLTCSLEIDCELLVSISHLSLQLSLYQILYLFWTKFCSSSRQQKTPTPMLAITLSDWETISLDKISGCSDEIFLKDHSCYQYLHPQVTLLSHLSLTEAHVLRWTPQETADRAQLRQHTRVFFSMMKANVNIFSSKSSLSSPSLHLFMTSLTSSSSPRPQ